MSERGDEGMYRIYLVGGPYNGQALDVPESMMKRGAVEMPWPDEVPSTQPHRWPALYLRTRGAWTVFQYQEPPRQTWHNSAATV